VVLEVEPLAQAEIRRVAREFLEGRLRMPRRAGFIGRYLARLLLSEGRRVRVLDSLIPRVHGDGARPRDLPVDAELLVGDVRDATAVRRAMTGIDKVVHLAAEVGVGQSEPHLPLELGCCRVLLEAAGHEVLMVDAHLCGLTQEQAAAEVAAFGPAMTVVTTAPT
jgi:GDP-D-mannose dehydratase